MYGVVKLKRSALLEGAFMTLYSAQIGRYQPTIVSMVGMMSPGPTGVIIGVLWCHTTSKY